MSATSRARRRSAAVIPASDATSEMPSWVVGLCGVAAVASLLFGVLLFLSH